MALVFFLVLGVASAADSTDVSVKEDSNLDDGVQASFSQDKLEISGEGSISETNIVNSQNDNLGYSDEAVASGNGSNENNLQASNVDDNDNGDVADSSSSDSNVKVSLNNDNSVSASSQESAVSESSVKASGAADSKDTTTLTHGATDTYILPNNKYVFTVTLKFAHNGPVSGAKIYFTYSNKKATAVTDKNGKASITIPVLSKGTYSISYSFNGDSRYTGSSESGKLHVQDSTVYFKASNLKMAYNDGSKFKVKVKDLNTKKPLANKKVKLTIKGKTYVVHTNSKGNAYLSIGLVPGVYKVKIKTSELGKADYKLDYKKITISKQNAVLKAYNLDTKFKDGSVYKVIVKHGGKYLKNVAVKFTINGRSYTHKTDSKGIAKLPIYLDVGYYPIKSVVSDQCYKSNTKSKKLLVDGTKFIGKSIYAAVGQSVVYSVKAVDGKSKPLKNVKVYFDIHGKTYKAYTDKNGVAKVNVGALKKGDHTIKFTRGLNSGTAKIHVVNKVSLSQIIDASQRVKSYIESNHKLPKTVKIGGITYSTADYLYMASEAIIHLKAGNKGDLNILSVASPSKPGAAGNKGNLYSYLSVAKSVVNTAESKGQMPNSVNSKVGTIGYNGLVYAFARVVAFYGDEKVMPSYVAIRSLDSGSSSTSNLNSKNTIKNLAAYLAASANCQVNDARIQKLVAKLTSGKYSDEAKARAIFNYVRDTVSYSFYYDTRYGAVGTLNAQTGNCVDHSHLLVAMYRAANLPARYVHGTCTFSSGSTYGHVWTQVLIGDTWTVSDATSSRNSFGNVVNWNSNSYSLNGYYASLPF